jgi:hypothetical protein
MDTIAKCFATLNALIAEPGPAGVPLAEKMVDELFAAAPTDSKRTVLLLNVRQKLSEIAKYGSREQAEFIKLVDDFIDYRMREILARKVRDDPPVS